MPTPPNTAAAVIGRVHREVVQVLDDLGGELAGRGEHQRAGRAARLVDQPVENREDERGRLAAAGHGAGQDVAARERRRDGVGLNRRGPGEPQLLYSFKETGMELERGERHGTPGIAR